MTSELSQSQNRLWAGVGAAISCKIFQGEKLSAGRPSWRPLLISCITLGKSAHSQSTWGRLEANTRCCQLTVCQVYINATILPQAPGHLRLPSLRGPFSLSLSSDFCLLSAWFFFFNSLEIPHLFLLLPHLRSGLHCGYLCIHCSLPPCTGWTVCLAPGLPLLWVDRASHHQARCTNNPPFSPSIPLTLITLVILQQCWNVSTLETSLPRWIPAPTSFSAANHSKDPLPHLLSYSDKILSCQTNALFAVLILLSDLLGHVTETSLFRLNHFFRLGSFWIFSFLTGCLFLVFFPVSSSCVQLLNIGVLGPQPYTPSLYFPSRDLI